MAEFGPGQKQPLAGGVLTKYLQPYRAILARNALKDSTRYYVLVHTLNMTKISSLPTRSRDVREDRIEPITVAIRALLDTLSPAEQERVLRVIQPATPRAGEVLGTIVRLLPNKTDWTVSKVRQDVADAGIEATAKEVYNAVGYLARRGHVKRLGYGRYIVMGALFETSEDLGLEPTRDECE